ncbi:MAG: transcription elongation factor GreA [Lysobacterales bacterium]|jgi:transcription elongation factor GreA
MSDIYLTRDFFHKLIANLEQLKKDSIKISGQIEEARLQGDLSENAEYDAAKEAQAMNAARQKDVESQISRAKIIQDQKIANDKIYIGAYATVQDLKTKNKITYLLVSEEESDFDNNMISVLSPIGRGLLAKAVGDSVEIKVPAGVTRYKVLKIERIT